MRDPELESRTAETRSRLAVVGTLCLSLAGGAIGLEIGTFWSCLAGLLLPPGATAIYLAHREPPVERRPLRVDP